jgi:hypothetical protein
MVKTCPILMLKQGCCLSPTLFVMYIDELETYLDKIDSPFNTMLTILFYVDDVVVLSESRKAY